MTRDLHTSIYLLNLELCEECSGTLGWNPAGAASGCMQGAAVEADAIGEQQSKRMQSGSSSRSGCDWDQQLKQTQSRSAAAGSGRKRGAAAEADAIGGQVDAIGEQQLCTESCPAPDYSRSYFQLGGKRTQSESSSSAQRAVRRRITHGRRTRGK